MNPLVPNQINDNTGPWTYSISWSRALPFPAESLGASLGTGPRMQMWGRPGQMKWMLPCPSLGQSSSTSTVSGKVGGGSPNPSQSGCLREGLEMLTIAKALITP